MPSIFSRFNECAAIRQANAFISHCPIVRQRAFSLIEMLVAMAVLAVLGVIIAQAINLSSTALSRSDKDMSAIAQMRLALDRLGADLAGGVVRRDVPIHVEKLPGNDRLLFYSPVPSALPTSAPRSISRIAYRVEPAGSTNAHQLARAAVGLSWTAAENHLVTIASDSPIGAPGFPPDDRFDILANSIFRFEVSFVSHSSAAAPGMVFTNFPATPAEWIEKVGAIRITVAALDTESRKMLPDGQIPVALANQFPDAVDGQSTIASWNEIAVDATALSAAAGIPAGVASSVRVFERTIPIR